MNRDHITSPSSRHDKWKRARQRPNGEYISDALREVTEKIVSWICFVCVILIFLVIKNVYLIKLCMIL